MKSYQPSKLERKLSLIETVVSAGIGIGFSPEQAASLIGRIAATEGFLDDPVVLEAQELLSPPPLGVDCLTD